MKLFCRCRACTTSLLVHTRRRPCLTPSICPVTVSSSDQPTMFSDLVPRCWWRWGGRDLTWRCQCLRYLNCILQGHLLYGGCCQPYQNFHNLFFLDFIFFMSQYDAHYQNYWNAPVVDKVANYQQFVPTTNNLCPPGMIRKKSGGEVGSASGENKQQEATAIVISTKSQQSQQRPRKPPSSAP